MTHSTPLSRILEYKQLEVLERERLRPLESFRNKLVPSDRKFMGGLILECKKASPSEGLIRADFNIAEIARVYSPFAQAISVLTDEKFFQGSFGLLAQARAQVTCPVLYKDFILSPYQVYEARLYQADMILLMLSVLDDKTYQTCAQAARKLNLDILTEVHDEQELERAVKLGAEIIGINNRDFKTLKVDLNTSRRLLSLVPKDKIKIVESGIENHDHIREFRDQCDGFLIGSSLMKQARLDLAVRDLIFGRTKICGLTSVEDAQAAYEHGAGFGGLIFAAESSRCVSLEQAEKIDQAVPLRWVGVFVNAPMSQVLDYAKKLNLYAVQLHGEEPEDYVKELDASLRWHDKVEIWRRCSKTQGNLCHASECWHPENSTIRYLFDTPHKSLHGGTGQSFDWNLIPESIPKDKIILSGGLGPHNIQDAEALGFWALDVNSQVEDSPGVKSNDKLKDLLAKRRGF